MTPEASDVPIVLLRQWQSRESQYGSTATYWGRLAMIQVIANDLSGARASLARSPKVDPAYNYAVDLASVQLRVQERLQNSNPMTVEDIAKFERAYAAVVAKHAKWSTGYSMLGAMQTMLGKHPDAIRNLEIALKGDEYQLWAVYRNLTISLSAVGRHSDALAAADKASRLNKTLLSDAPFAIAVANSHSALGYLEDAADILKVIAVRRPDIKNDPTYLRAIEHYRIRRSRSSRTN